MTENNVSNTSENPPKPPPELKRLEPLLGKWRSKDQVAWWLRDDHGDWQPWMQNTFFRTK
jgi:hypothetical protein